MPWEVTRAERAGWQRRAATELAEVLDANRDLPVIAWTVGPAGSVLVGQVYGPAAAGVRAAFDTWRAALALDAHTETRCATGTVYLRSARGRNRVQFVLLATVFDEDGGEQG
jgi:hypothetical protein